MRKLVLAVVVLAAGGILVTQWPEIQRYLKIERM